MILYILKIGLWFYFSLRSTEQTSRQLVIDYILSSGENYVDVFDVST